MFTHFITLYLQSVYFPLHFHIKPHFQFESNTLESFLEVITNLSSKQYNDLPSGGMLVLIPVSILEVLQITGTKRLHGQKLPATETAHMTSICHTLYFVSGLLGPLQIELGPAKMDAN